MQNSFILNSLMVAEILIVHSTYLALSYDVSGSIAAFQSIALV